MRKKFTDQEEMIINIIEVQINDKIINDKNLLQNIFFESHCVIFLINLESEESLIQIKNLMISLEKNDITKKFVKYSTNILVLNKSDLESEIKAKSKNINDFLSKYPFLESKEFNFKDKNFIIELNKIIYNSLTKKENMIYPIDNIKINENLNDAQKSILKNFFGESISCIILGDSSTGKSSFLVHYFQNEDDIFKTTLGIDKEVKIVNFFDEKIKFVLWDTAGQERLKCLPKKYLENSDGIFMLFDPNIKDSFENVINWVKDAKCNIPINKKINIYLISNKIDSDRKITREEAEKMAEDLGLKYFECSVKLFININEIISHMIYECYENKNNCIINFKDKKLNKTKKKNKFCQHQ